MAKVSIRGEKAEERALTHAKDSVAVFHQTLEEWQQAQIGWEQQYPEAFAEKQHLDELEETVKKSADVAKNAVRDARQDVDDFRCQLKFSEPHYEGNKVLEIVIETDDYVTLRNLAESGIIKNLTLDKDLADVWFERHPEEAKKFKHAWKDREEMTPAIFTPKW
jgi:hypothetical protein